MSILFHKKYYLSSMTQESYPSNITQGKTMQFKTAYNTRLLALHNNSNNYPEQTDELINNFT